MGWVGHGRLVAAQRVRWVCGPRPGHAGAKGYVHFSSHAVVIGCEGWGGVGGAWQAGSSPEGTWGLQPEA
jgi:hypothetical protein